MAYYYYEPQDGQSPTSAVYIHCPANCDVGSNWNGVSMGEGVREVQLELTAAGQPRLLYRTTSTVQNGGTDYYYAECNTNCTDSNNWQTTLVVTSFGTSIFDIGEDNLPQRYFALDPEGRPRFLYLDRNYLVEPDHYGLFYVTCESDCTDPAQWSQALISAVIQEEFFFDWEVITFTSLTFTSSGQPRFIGELIPLADQGERVTALYYFACDTGCDEFANWSRVQIGERGQGSDLSWDLALDANDRPRVVHYPADLPDDKAPTATGRHERPTQSHPRDRGFDRYLTGLPVFLRPAFAAAPGSRPDQRIAAPVCLVGTRLFACGSGWHSG